MVDYSKWNNIELSDDDEADCHPNIEKNTWMRLKKQQREQKKADEKAKHEHDLKQQHDYKQKIAELEKKAADDAKAKQDLETVKKQEAALAKQLAEEEERKAKFVKWDKDSICREGFSKTIINSDKKPAAAVTATATATAAVDTQPKAVAEPALPPKNAVPAASVVLTENKPEMSEAEMDKYVQEMEIKAHAFAACKNYDEYYEYLRAHPEILLKETNDYLLLHVSDFIKKGNFALSKKYCIAACLIQYSRELGPQGPQMLFHRLRDPNPAKNYKKDFETQTMDYWELIKVKILELQAQRAARKAQGLPEDPTSDGDAADDEDEGDGEETAEFSDAVDALEIE